MLTRVLKYLEKIAGWEALLDAVRDSRQAPQIPTARVVRGLVAMFLCRLGSLNATAQTRASSFWRQWLRGELPSADTLGRVAGQVEVEAIRAALRQVYGTLKRAKMLAAPAHGLNAAVVDGHESHATYRRHCSGCLARELQTASGPRTQYYHRYVALRLITGTGDLMLDLEPQRSGEDEVAAALRLLARVLESYPRAFDVVLADGLYAKANFFNYLRAHGKYALAVLKDDQRALLGDAQALFETQEPARLRIRGREASCWDLEGFTTWPQVQGLVRVVRCQEHWQVKRQKDKQLEELTAEWCWVTNLPQTVAPTPVVAGLGHDRWDIENQGFNEMVNHWHTDHVYRHQETAMLVLWLLALLCLNLFLIFYRRNLRPELRQVMSQLHVSRLLAAELYAGWSSPIPPAPP